MTATVFKLPDLGEGLTEAEILEWKVSVGDTVTTDQIIVEVETAKAAVDVPVPIAGTVAELFAEAGTVVDVGSPLIAISPETALPDAAAERYREEEQAGSGNVLVGYGTTETRRSRRRAARPEPAHPAAVAQDEAPRVISPVVRRLAKDNGIDVATLTPTGPGGVILRCDVEQAIAGTAPTAAPPAAQATAPAAEEHREAADVVRVPLKGVRRTMAEKLSRSRREIPDATTWVDVDATRLVKLKKRIGEADPDAGVGMLALFAAICVAGLRRFPELNAYVDTEREEIVRLPHVHLGFAAQTERGLVVPVVRDAHLLPLADLAAALRERTEEAREGRLSPGDLTGGTFTLNNYGVFGVDGSTPIINHPEAAMLGVGRIAERPWAHKGKVRLRQVTQLSFTFDHRVCDGGVAGGFLRFVADCVERPEMLVSRR
ncbi:pyruvate dehydrogenase E2 component (dihydrolipoamide acetyltransferase) [Actinomadura meyerae]|uniref:Dihydrolipoamide acetyltransferase component of pyruvate dehydrogenase complex n=1 Tax=Actinomadura meyerae TaxID=240840 RepID=A0A239F5Q8_9ACTN|nr:dihydrolipoamide acetyltransferase family protein [Actinomadura meyerae]SNS52145.1 pyruvate dehydrogenase E2 component (dihydrolipoamide acetyltransferase) [Actinomadura meyerae]